MQFEEGKMLAQLHEVEVQLPKLLLEQEWESLDVDYEPPRVERVWRKHGDLRVCLHRIHPCERALMHPHPWPSAMRVVKGTYEMRLGDGGVDGLSGQQGYHKVATLTLAEGSTYEMVDPHAWHNVRPLGGVAYSLMVMGPKYTQSPFDHKKFGQGRDLKRLSAITASEILSFFADWADSRG